MTTDYMTTTCTNSVSMNIARRLQTSTSLTYSNSMSCTYTITVPSGYFVQANIRRFELEEKRYGACVDYANFYDGGSTGSTKLNTDPYCDQSAPSQLASTGTKMTIEFHSDNSAVYRGFDIIFAAATNAPCSGDQFACSNSKCVSSLLYCDNYNHCGDESDEANCTVAATTTAADNTALIAGLTIGLTVLVLVCVFTGIYIYRYYRWKLFLKDPVPKMKQWKQDNSYPVTKKYYRAQYQTLESEKSKSKPGNGGNDEKTSINDNSETRTVSPPSTQSNKERVKFAHKKRESMA